jgi:hypothetical protein
MGGGSFAQIGGPDNPDVRKPPVLKAMRGDYAGAVPIPAPP